MVAMSSVSIFGISLLDEGSYTVNAQGLCDFFPCDQTIDGSTNSGNVNSAFETWFRFGVGLIFTGFIAFGVFIIVKNATKIINSQGSEEKLSEGVSAIKTVFIGVIMLLVGIIGLLVLASLFGAGGIFNSDVETPAGVENLPIID